MIVMQAVLTFGLFTLNSDGKPFSISAGQD